MLCLIICSLIYIVFNTFRLQVHLFFILMTFNKFKKFLELCKVCEYYLHVNETEIRGASCVASHMNSDYCTKSTAYICQVSKQLYFKLNFMRNMPIVIHDLFYTEFLTKTILKKIKHLFQCSNLSTKPFCNLFGKYYRAHPGDDVNLKYFTLKFLPYVYSAVQCV